MCNWGNTRILKLNGKSRAIDNCIFDLVKILNKNGIKTVACCCGHNKRPGNIALDDGRELIMARNYEEGRAIDKAFPPIN